MSDEKGRATLLTLPEAAARLHLTVSCLRAWKDRRRITYVRIGNRIRIPAGEIDRLIGEGTVPARAVRQ
jgi:excisionase family DNA binding protein